MKIISFLIEGILIVFLRNIGKSVCSTFKNEILKNTTNKNETVAVSGYVKIAGKMFRATCNCPSYIKTLEDMVYRSQTLCRPSKIKIRTHNVPDGPDPQIISNFKYLPPNDFVYIFEEHFASMDGGDLGMFIEVLINMFDTTERLSETVITELMKEYIKSLPNDTKFYHSTDQTSLDGIRKSLEWDVIDLQNINFVNQNKVKNLIVQNIGDYYLKYLFELYRNNTIKNRILIWSLWSYFNILWDKSDEVNERLLLEVLSGPFNPQLLLVRFTNVATVRLKVHGERFEIACYKNKVVNWRSGVETDIQEVLQSPYIFTSISKGKLANNIQLMKAFNTTDINKITKQILDKGEFQISKEERNQILESTFRDIVSILHEVTINPNTGHPLTRSLLENALKSSGFSVSLNEPPKKQALKAISLLQKHYPESIARCKMRLRVNFLSHQYQDLTGFFQGKDITVEQNSVDNLYNTSNSSSNVSSSFCSPNKLNKVQNKKRNNKYMDNNKENNSRDDRENDKEFNKNSENDKEFNKNSENDKEDKEYNNNKKENKNKNKPKQKELDEEFDDYNEKMEYMLFICPPNLFREIENFVLNKLEPSGTLQLITLNIKENPSSISTPSRSPYNFDNDDGEELLLNKVDSMSVRQSDSELTEVPSDRSKEMNRELKIQKVNEEFGVSKDERVLGGTVLGQLPGSSNSYSSNTDTDSNREKERVDEMKIQPITVDSTKIDTNKKRCLNCNIEFDDSTFYRKHFKSDFHVFNSKRKLQGLDPISQDEYQHIQSNLT